MIFFRRALVVMISIVAVLYVTAATNCHALLQNTALVNRDAIFCTVASFMTGAVVSAFILFFIRKTVLKRLSLLSVTVKQISTHRNISSRLSDSGKNDELSDLVGSINSMLDSLESSDKAMRESEERYRMLFERAPDAIVIIGMDGDEAGCIVAANQAAADQHGYTVEEICALRIFDLNTVESNMIAGSVFERVARGEWVTTDLWHHKKDGTMFPIEVHAGLVKINGRNYALGFDRDITVRKLAEEADSKSLEQINILNAELARKADDLAAANKELDAFNYSVSHDMRGPLTRISGYCQLMLDDDQKLDPQLHTYLTRIYQASCWLDEMIDAMLSLSRLTVSEFKVETIDLSSIALEALNDLALSDESRSVQIDVKSGVTVEGDRQLLKILMTNLLGNAWKYSACQESGHIEFGSMEDRQGTVYYVRDNGAGFDMKNADKLFRVFYRFHDSTQFSGNGIGLATAQRIVERHGGRIWAVGDPGKGATFNFTLRRDEVINLA